MKNLPEIVPDDFGRPPNSPSNAGVSYNVNVKEVHLRASDIDALRRLAEVDPDFAREVLASQERSSRRETNSMTIGMITAGSVVLALIAAMTVSVVFLGWWQSLLVALLILCASHALRVLLTGVWSETSWFGKFVTGNKPPSDEE